MQHALQVYHAIDQSCHMCQRPRMSHSLSHRTHYWALKSGQGSRQMTFSYLGPIKPF